MLMIASGGSVKNPSGFDVGLTTAPARPPGRDNSCAEVASQAPKGT